MKNRVLTIRSLILIWVFASLCGCATLAPIQTESNVDLERFMGDWYVIAHIPTFLEDEAFNAVETYELGESGRVKTTFRFNNKAFDGKEKVYRPTGFVQENTGNGRWKMQFIWPFKGDYRIGYLSPDYQHTIIARQKRDFVWIMARNPMIDDADYAFLVRQVELLGYELDKLRKVPQQPLSER